MPASSQSAHQRPLTSFDFGFDDDLPQLFAGDRVGPPSRHVVRPASTWLQAWLVIFALFGACAVFLKLPDAWRAAIGAQAWAFVDVAMKRTVYPEPLPPKALPSEASAESAAPLPAASVSEAPGAKAGTLVQETPAPIQDKPTPPAADADMAEAAPEPLPAPVADAADPLQQRALAIGLHPDLSHAVLERLSEADWRNAEYAIHAALLQSTGLKTFTWPKSEAAKSAQFEVRFVAAAGTDCRRYVVTLTKDRWSTTARAMELCGEALPKAKRG